MSRPFEILSMHERGIERHDPDFNEMLYDNLRQTPWYLASLGAHGGVFLVLALLGGGTAPPPVVEGIQGEVSAFVPELDPDIQPEVIETTPMAQLEKVEVSQEIEVASQTEVETDPEESRDDHGGDPRFSADDLPFTGNGTNGDIGIGGGGGGCFSGRAARVRTLSATGGGGVLGPTDAGLQWLKFHQSPGGFWDCDGFEAMCKKNKCGGPGGPLFDPGVSGLALLAFLGHGDTHKSGTYRSTVSAGVKYLKASQDAEGCFGPRTSNHFTYNHAIAALAMAEAYGMTQSPLLKVSAQNGINFVHQTQNPYLAWRYGVRPQDNDTSVTGWMVMALKSAKAAGLEVDPAAFDGARAWLDKVTEPEYGRAGYTARGNGPARPTELLDRFPADKSESLTAVAVLTRIFCGAQKGDDAVKKGADLCLKNLPVYDEAAGTIDYYYWYYGTLAMFQVGGDHWKRWDEAMKKAVIDTQKQDKSDDRYGSWDAVDPWAADGGRIYSTAMNVLSLEVVYRYERVFTGK